MAYTDKLKDAKYESPSGIETTFDFVELSRDINHRIGTFEFSGVNGTLHQDKGISGEVYPLRMFIHGQDYDLQADRFFESTKEIGHSFLNHPRWGRRRVQIISITQLENLVDGAGQAIFDVQFQETLEREFPLTASAPQVQVQSLSDTAQETSIDNFSDQIDVEELKDELAHEQEIKLSATKVQNSLESITSTSESIATQFRTAIDNVFNNAAEYVQEPFEYATQITSAIRVVAEVPGRISAKIQGFRNLLDVLKLRDVTSSIRQNKNALLVDELLGTMAIVAVSESINQALSQVSTLSRNGFGKATITVPSVGVGFQTREELLSAVNYLQENSTGFINYLDEGQEVFENNILSESYIQSVQSYVPTWIVAGTVIKSALDISFQLPIKRTIILPNSRTIIDLCYEFYKNIDDTTLDYFILTNLLSGDEIIEVPRGKRVVFYE